jgi:hypothetical protein
MAANIHSEYVIIIDFFFFTETMVARTRLTVMLHVRCLFCLLLFTSVHVL